MPRSRKLANKSSKQPPKKNGRPPKPTPQLSPELPDIKNKYFNPDKLIYVRTVKLKVSQGYLATQIGISPNQLKHWEKGQAQPRPVFVRVLAMITGEKFEFFYDDELEQVANPQ
jgi:DNA-binding transcriptional regulator YiaG